MTSFAQSNGLFQAVKSGDAAQVTRLLDDGADLHAIDKVRVSTHTSFHCASGVDDNDAWCGCSAAVHFWLVLCHWFFDQSVDDRPLG